MTTKICPYCAETIQQAAIKCRYCGSLLAERPLAAEWKRDLDNKMIGGVCSGLARQFGISVTALRIAFVIAVFAGGWGLLIYFALWIIMPVAASSAKGAPPLLEGTRPPSSSSTGPEETTTPPESDEPRNG